MAIIARIRETVLTKRIRRPDPGGRKETDAHPKKAWREYVHAPQPRTPARTKPRINMNAKPVNLFKRENQPLAPTMRNSWRNTGSHSNSKATTRKQSNKRDEEDARSIITDENPRENTAASNELRAELAAYFQAKKVAATSSYPHWGCPSAIVAASTRQPRLLVGDPIALAVSTRLLSCCCLLALPHTHTHTF